jgi:ATP-dependent DNA ligase
VPVKFIEPMLLLRTERLQEGKGWMYEIKFDGYRAVAFKTGGKSTFGREMIMISPFGILALQRRSHQCRRA